MVTIPPDMSEFEAELRGEVAIANTRQKGTSPAPWEVIMESVIALERRVINLEKQCASFQRQK